MNRHAFRSVSRQVRPAEVEQSLSSYFRQFSTSTPVRDDAPPPKPSPRAQSRAAADSIRTFAVNKSPRPTATGPDAGPRVVDVKSLPRGGLRGRGGFRGGMMRGGGAAGGRSGSPNRFAGAGGATRGGGRGGRGRRPRRPRKDGEEEEEGKREYKKKVDEVDIIEPSQQAFENAMRFGVTSTFTPSVTPESLAPHMPAVAATSGPRAAAVHQSLSALGTADHVGIPGEFPPTMYALDLKERGIRYFADIESKERTEAYMQQERLKEAKAKAEAEGGQGPVEVSNERIISDAEEAIRKVVLDEAVAGKHAAPEYATDPVSIARNWHLRAETWRTKETKAFEEKLKSMLEKSKAGKKVKA